MRELTLEEVQTILTEGVALARSKGFPSTVAVVDMGGNVRGVLRPEKGRIANPDIAIKKAWTAAALHRSTAQVRDIMITTDKFGHGLQFTDEDFHWVTRELQWIVDGYNLAFAALVLSTVLGALIAFHPTAIGKVDTVEEAELPKVQILCALIGAMVGVIVLEYGLVVGFVVFGLGGIGLNVIQGAKLAGANRIVGIDINPDREEWGRKFGMTHFVNPKEAGDDLVLAGQDPRRHLQQRDRRSPARRAHDSPPR